MRRSQSAKSSAHPWSEFQLLQKTPPSFFARETALRREPRRGLLFPASSLRCLLSRDRI